MFVVSSFLKIHQQSHETEEAVSLSGLRGLWGQVPPLLVFAPISLFKIFFY